MKKVIGIRREDKNEWEKRVPLIPSDVQWLKEEHGIETIIQPSAIRVFSDDEYRRAGAVVSEDLCPAKVVFAVKEIPIDLFQPGKGYVFFSHTIKGQPYNMPMLRHMMELKNHLIDYERVVDEKQRRLIFFGRYAGLAGMIDTLHGFGRKLQLQGFTTPFAKIRQAYQYASLEEAKREIAAVGREIEEHGFPPELSPLVFAFTGYGNVSRGAQEIFDLLPFKAVSPDILIANVENFSADNYNLYKVVFKEEDIVSPKSGVFQLQEYYEHPERYESKFEEYLPAVTVLVNCIYWTEKYPRLVTKEYLKNNTILQSNLRLRIIGDISCDIDGSVEITYKATKPDHAFYTYFAETNEFREDITRQGVTVMAVDNLPCEFSAESSQEFSQVLREFVPPIMAADFAGDDVGAALPYPIRTALILHRGELTAGYRYIENFLHQEQA